VPKKSLNTAVGHRIAELRRDRGLSLSALAAAARVGKGSLSELEAGERNPTLATLYALAGPLEVPLATLLGDEIGVAVTAEGFSSHLIDVRRSASTVRETYRLELLTGAHRRSPAHGPGVREHLLVTEGSIFAGAEGSERRCDAGEWITWISDREHHYRAPDQPAAAILVIITPLASPAN
jgi:XRE family transcriptional regulator, regulator of sulfur utilization